MKTLRLATICLGMSGAALGAQNAQSTNKAPAAPPTEQRHVCHINPIAPNDGDVALAKKDYDLALTYFRAAVEKEPASADAQLGLVRALVGKDQTVEAMKQAQDALGHFPHSAVAEVAAGEAAFRAADFSSARNHVLQASDEDGCEGRALDLAANLYSIHAYFATAAALLANAHKLRPNDELILRDWIDSLPRKQREVELARYLEGTNALSTRDRADYSNEETA